MQSPTSSSVGITKFGNNILAMTRQIILERTLKITNQLPEDKEAEISDFADFF